MKVYWLSRHELSPAQVAAVRDLHGEDAEVVKDPAVFRDAAGLTEYIVEHPDGFVYAVAGAPHYIFAALAGLRFGVFGLAAVYHVVGGTLQKVWANPDPASDTGEALIPVARTST